MCDVTARPDPEDAGLRDTGQSRPHAPVRHRSGEDSRAVGHREAERRWMPAGGRTGAAGQAGEGRLSRTVTSHACAVVLLR